MSQTQFSHIIEYSAPYQTVVVFVSTVYDNPVSGPATYARLLHAAFNAAPFAFVTITSDAALPDHRMVSIPKTKRPSRIYKELWKTAREVVSVLKGKKVIVHFNNAFPYVFFGRLGDLSFIQLNDYFNIEVPYLLRGKYTLKVKLYHIARKFTERRSVAKTDMLICNSKYTYDKARKYYGIPERKCTLIYKSMRLDEMGMRSSAPAQGRILYVGNDLYRKGFDILAKALCLTTQVRTLQIAGPGFFSEQEKLFLAMIPKHIQVELLGSLASASLYQAMTQTDLVVIPARYEALGVAVIESLSQGVPVITSGVGGLQEVLEGYPAIFGDSGNLQPETLAWHIDSIFSRYTEYLQITQDNVEKIRTNYSPVTMTAKLQKLYLGES